MAASGLAARGVFLSACGVSRCGVWVAPLAPQGTRALWLGARCRLSS